MANGKQVKRAIKNSLFYPVVTFMIFFPPPDPSWPEKAVFGHQIVEFENDIIIVGGEVNQYDTSKALYKFSCTNQVCKLEKMDQELQVPRYYHVAIAVPDKFCKYAFCP